MNQQTNDGTFQELNRAVLTYIIVFNKRRSGEVSKMEVKNFTDARENRYDSVYQEMFATLSELEKKVAKENLLVKVIGKKGRHVSALVPTFVCDAIDVLLVGRSQYNVPEGNVYLFAKPWTENYLDGCRCVRHFSNSFGLKKPKAITTTKLRKHLATCLQVLNLSENEMEWVAGFLGHTVDVHRLYYRAQDDTIYLTKVAKIIAASNLGQVSLNAGRNLDQVEFDEGSDLTDQNTSDEDTESNIPM